MEATIAALNSDLSISPPAAQLVCWPKTAFLPKVWRSWTRGGYWRVDHYKKPPRNGMPMSEITTGHKSNARAKCWHVVSGGIGMAMIALPPSPNAPLPKEANDNGVAWPFIPFPDQLVRRLLIELAQNFPVEVSPPFCFERRQLSSITRAGTTFVTCGETAFAATWLRR